MGSGTTSVAVFVWITLLLVSVSNTEAAGNSLSVLHQTNIPGSVQGIDVYNNFIYAASYQSNQNGAILFLTQYDMGLKQLQRNKMTFLNTYFQVLGLNFVQNNKDQSWAGYLLCTVRSNDTPWLFQFDPTTLAFTANKTLPAVSSGRYLITPFLSEAYDAFLFMSQDSQSFLQCGLFETLGECSPITFKELLGVPTVKALTMNTDPTNPMMYLITNCSQTNCNMVAYDGTQVTSEYTLNISWAEYLSMSGPFFGYSQNNGEERLYWTQNGFKDAILFVTFDPNANSGHGGIGSVSKSSVLNEPYAFLSPVAQMDITWVAFPLQMENSIVIVCRLGGLSGQPHSLLQTASTQAWAQAQYSTTVPVPIPNTNQAVYGLGPGLYIYG